MFFGYAIIAGLLLPLYFKLNLTSIYTYLEQRFGLYSYKTGASFFIISRLLGATVRTFLVIFVLYNFVLAPLGVPFVVAAIVFNSMLKSIVMAMRDDDEDETYIEKYFEHFVGDLKDNLNPLTLIPFVKDVVSIFQGYDVERMDMALFSDLKNAIDAMDSDSKTEYEKWIGLAGAISALFGIPLKNVERDLRGLYNTIKSFINQNFITKWLINK
jgi:hypothetical protein